MKSLHPLMHNNITRSDLDKVIEFLRSDDPILTQSSQVSEFEREWSDWLGVRFSVFVNSGSSANLLSMALLRQRHSRGGEVIVPALTWVSDIVAVINQGFTPVFVDIDPHTLGMDAKQVISRLSSETRAVFLTHAQGFNGLTNELWDELQSRDIPLIEDVSESHGATHHGKKLGSIGWISNFSFYYAHHMSTIEGGMICTDDPEAYQCLRMLRSHGMTREASDPELKKQYIDKYPQLNPDFIFAVPGFNVRNTEIGAVLGRNQLLRLDSNVEKRNLNLRRFLGKLDSERYQTEFNLDGCSNYAFNLILREANEKLVNDLMRRLDEGGIEYRRGSAGGGNQLRQPYLKKYLSRDCYLKYPVVEHIHFFGFYIGNYPDLSCEAIERLCDIVNG